MRFFFFFAHGLIVYESFLNISDLGAITSNQSGPGNNGNKTDSTRLRSPGLNLTVRCSLGHNLHNYMVSRILKKYK